MISDVTNRKNISNSVPWSWESVRNLTRFPTERGQAAIPFGDAHTNTTYVREYSPWFVDQSHILLLILTIWTFTGSSWKYQLYYKHDCIYTYYRKKKWKIIQYKKLVGVHFSSFLLHVAFVRGSESCPDSVVTLLLTVVKKMFSLDEELSVTMILLF